jgi:hypothetical protein
MLDPEDEVCMLIRNADYYVEAGGASYPSRPEKNDTTIRISDN